MSRAFASPLPLLLALVAASGLALGAQAPGRERTVFASAVDGSGKPVEGLGLADFVVREDGARREILRVSRAIEPIDIALLVDNSAASRELLLSLRNGLKQFVATMLPARDASAAPESGGPRHNIALVGLAGRPTILVDYTSDAKRLTDAIERLFPDSTSGMTLLDAIVEVSRGVEKRESPRAVIVPVITDGLEFSNRYHTDVIGAMTSAGAAFHALTVGTFGIVDDDAMRSRSVVLDEGARATGGQRVVLLSDTGVPGALERLAAELLAQYKVVYGHPDSLLPPKKIEVTASRPGVTVRATPLRGQKTGG